MIQIHPKDNVGVALRDTAAGAVRLGVCAREPIPRGHKMALCPLAPGDPVVKYGAVIGSVTAPVQPGDWLHTHNMKTNLSGQEEYRYAPSHPVLPPEEPETFPGFCRPDGSVGVRNEVWILPTVGCVGDVARRLAAENAHLAAGTVDGIYAFPHPYGCSQTGEDHARTRRLLAALARHPNAGGVLVLSLGCENLTKEQFLEELGDFDPRRIRFLCCQEVEDEQAEGRALLEELADYAGSFHRESVPVSRLVVGMKCGGSDGLSGVTANPVVGRFTDRLTARGGTAILTEVPEMFGAESMLLHRCQDEAVFRSAAEMLGGFRDYFLRNGENVYENPSPGNKAGGITTLEDKSCGCVQKGGAGPIVDVLEYGESVRRRGLVLLNGPGNDLVSATALTAAGAQIILFTTGRGTPFGAPAPTLKIATNSALTRQKPGWVDLNTGTAAEGTRTLDELAEDLLQLVIATASGQKTRSERSGYREIAIWKGGVTL